MQIDIHTHGQSRPNIIQLKNLDSSLSESNVDQVKNTYYQVGLHPWHADQQLDHNWMVKMYRHSQVIGIGETGLDRVKGPNIETQKKTFEAHLDLLEELNCRLLVLHIVKSFSDFFPYLKRIPENCQLLFHDYHGGPTETEKLLERGNCYFSYGAMLDFQNSKAMKSLKQIPLSQLFLETDNGNKSIEEIYSTASRILNQDIKSLELQLENNFKNLINEI